MTSPTPFAPLSALTVVGLDTETTGLRAATARLVQIGAVRLGGMDDPLGETFLTLIDPGEPIPPASTAIHGISDGDVTAAPCAGEAIPRLLAFLGDAVVVGHTIGYDLEVLRREAERCGVAWTPPAALDIRFLAQAVLHTIAGYDLDALCAFFGITIAGRHTADGDAAAAARVYQALLPKLRERGIRTLAEAQAVSRRLSERDGAGGTDAGLRHRAETEAPERIDPYPYRRTVSAVMSSPPVAIAAESPLRDALALLIDKGVSSVFVEDSSGSTGIVTERDILRLIQERGTGALDMSLAEARSAPLATVRADDLMYRAIGRMDRLGIRHLGVTDEDGRIIGAVTARNLLRHRASTAMALGDEIAAGEDDAALAAAWGRVPAIARSLTAEDIGAGMIAGVISAEIRMLTRRAAEIGEARLRTAGHGEPPARYAVLVLGSAGRGESLLAADQDNAIVYDAAGDDDPAADRYFALLGAEIADRLDAIGIRYCNGGVMAREAAWRKSDRGWRQTVGGWIGRQRPEDLLNVDIFFDATVVHGDRALGDALLGYGLERARQTPSFQVALSQQMRDWRTPVTLLGGFRTGADGRIDLKAGGLMQISAAARILAIKAGSAARPTPERLRAAAAAGLASETQLERLIEAHGIILDAILRQQVADAVAGIQPGNRVAPADIPKARRAELRDALRQVPGALDLTREGML